MSLGFTLLCKTKSFTNNNWFNKNPQNPSNGRGRAFNDNVKNSKNSSEHEEGKSYAKKKFFTNGQNAPERMDTVNKTVNYIFYPKMLLLKIIRKRHFNPKCLYLWKSQPIVANSHLKGVQRQAPWMQNKLELQKSDISRPKNVTEFQRLVITEFSLSVPVKPLHKANQ